MSSIPIDIRQRIVDDFGDERATDIYSYLLAKIPEGLPNGTRPRLLRCILSLANGDMNQLNHYIDVCLCDPRDVMFAAESRKRDFSEPFADSEIE